MFKVKVRRPSGNVVVLPRTYATIVEAQGAPLNSGDKVAVVYANGTLAKRLDG